MRRIIWSARKASTVAVGRQKVAQPQVSQANGFLTKSCTKINLWYRLHVATCWSVGRLNRLLNGRLNRLLERLLDQPCVCSRCSIHDVWFVQEAALHTDRVGIVAHRLTHIVRLTHIPTQPEPHSMVHLISLPSLFGIAPRHHASMQGSSVPLPSSTLLRTGSSPSRIRLTQHRTKNFPIYQIQLTEQKEREKNAGQCGAPACVSIWSSHPNSPGNMLRSDAARFKQSQRSALRDPRHALPFFLHPQNSTGFCFVPNCFLDCFSKTLFPTSGQTTVSETRFQSAFQTRKFGFALISSIVICSQPTPSFKLMKFRIPKSILRSVDWRSIASLIHTVNHSLCCNANIVMPNQRDVYMMIALWGAVCIYSRRLFLLFTLSLVISSFSNFTERNRFIQWINMFVYLSKTLSVLAGYSRSRCFSAFNKFRL